MVEVAESLEGAYFTWLYNRVGVYGLRNYEKSYTLLCEALFGAEFTWTHILDENRAGDGLSLRDAFCVEQGIDREGFLLGVPCSMFEMLVALSDRLAFQLDGYYEGTAGDWFWVMIKNLGLINHTDGVIVAGGDIRVAVNEAVSRFINRQYARNGKGGLFQVSNRRIDMREEDIWTQLSAFCSELVRVY